MIKYSIIVPVYNAEKSICRCINSVLNQSFQEYEIIAIDDGSIDNSLKILKEIEKKTNKLRIYHQENAGPGVARNHGIELSKGEYIAFLDADDYLEEDYLETISKCSNDFTKDVIFINVIKETEKGCVLSKSNNSAFRNNSKKELIHMQMTGRLPWGGMVKVVKRNLINNMNILFTELEVGEEALFSYEILKNAQDISFVDKPIYHYVLSPFGQHKKGNYDPWKPIVDSFKDYLIEMNEYDEYKNTINSLALKALCICIYRYSSSECITRAAQNIKQKYAEYRKEYDFDKLNYMALEKKIILIFIFLKLNLYIPLILASRFRKRRITY